jgi:predicted N-acyltransferase
MGSMEEMIQISVIAGLDEVSEEHWNLLAGDHDPFLEYGFLRSLEVSGSVGEGTGWIPCYVIARKEDRLVGAVPLYLKDNSYGEYIFDWSWADASYRSGIPYYPKLVSAIPFTPVGGERILMAKGEASPVLFQELLDGVRGVAEKVDAHSIHFLFATSDQRADLVEKGGYLSRLTYQYHWENQGYSDFDSFLNGMRSGPRKEIRKERKRAAASGLQIRMVEGTDLEERAWEALYRFYRDTTDRKGAMPYLTPLFFQEIRNRLPHRVLLGLAEQGEDVVAVALFFQKGNRLLGRYWGCEEFVRDLHFELCYYQPIAYCIEKGIAHFEAGAQGDHKIKRGLLPRPTYSAHWIQHPGLREAVAEYLPREAAASRHEMIMLREKGPFKRDG